MAIDLSSAVDINKSVNNLNCGQSVYRGMKTCQKMRDMGYVRALTDLLLTQHTAATTDGKLTLLYSLSSDFTLCAMTIISNLCVDQNQNQNVGLQDKAYFVEHAIP